MSTAETSPRRTRARRGEGDRLREDIMAAAERLLIETGDADAVSIRAVANAVGVTPPSIYLHFADKTELIFEICQVHWHRFDDALSRATVGIDDPIAALRACGRAYIEFGLANPEHYRILFMSKPQELPPGVDMSQLLMEGGFERLVGFAGEAVSQGRLVGEPQAIVLLAWSMVHGITSLLISKPDMPWPDRDVLIDQLQNTMVRGLSPPP